MFTITIGGERIDITSLVDDSPVARAMRPFVKVRRQGGRVCSLQIDGVIIRNGHVFDTDAKSRPVLSAIERLKRRVSVGGLSLGELGALGRAWLEERE